jgi:hypothetical protein
MIFLYGYDEDESGPVHPYESVAYQRMKTAADTPAAEAVAALKNKEDSEDKTSEKETSDDDSKESNENLKADRDTSLVVTSKVATKTKP